MNIIQRIIILSGALLVLISVLFPPFAAGKLPVGENIHRSIGYHPIWSRPTVESAYFLLHGQAYDPEGGEDLSNYFVMFNKVGFIIQLLFIILVAFILLIVFRNKRRTPSGA